MTLFLCREARPTENGDRRCVTTSGRLTTRA
jgi:hypothetical protein